MTDYTSSLELRLLSFLAIFYLGFKLIVFPGVVLVKQTIEPSKYSLTTLIKPEVSATDLIFILLILGFSPSSSQLFRSLRVNSQGFQAEFKGVEKTIEKQIVEIHKV